VESQPVHNTWEVHVFNFSEKSFGSRDTIIYLLNELGGKLEKVEGVKFQ